MYLNCHSYYSFKYGTMSPEQLLAEAKQKGISSLALTDINNTSGILDFFRLAPKYNIKPVAGIDFRSPLSPDLSGAEGQGVRFFANCLNATFCHIYPTFF